MNDTGKVYNIKLTSNGMEMNAVEMSPSQLVWCEFNQQRKRAEQEFIQRVIRATQSDDFEAEIEKAQATFDEQIRKIIIPPFD